jgi:hypothetical protein
MQRIVSGLMVLVFGALITGCGEDSSVNTAPSSPAAAKEAAAKMPPPTTAAPAAK